MVIMISSLESSVFILAFSKTSRYIREEKAKYFAHASSVRVIMEEASHI